ncbi:heterokaryon incompatibility protein-domain-containing protein, partial [Fusarium tricinctum]
MSVTRDRALGQRWLSNCRANHPQCSSSPLHRVFEGLEGGNFPTRLIDVSRWAEKLVRICDSRNDSALFTALSHRWLKGQMPEWVTKKANRHTRLAWFSSAGLPKSIQDALQATAELGLRYTWIDSLCIVQDDMADWGREAAQMASIYAQAEVTIFADCASDDSKGFLGERKNHPTIIRYAYDVPHTPSKEDDNASDQYLHTNHVDVSFHKDVTESHLSNRGWILQERLLSRRSLHFGRSQMYWECPSVIVSEEGHDIDGRRHQEWVIHAREALMGSSESREIGRRCWKDIVSAYSRMKLTKPSDRLPAIAGIAKVFSTYLGDKYFCGTWSDTFYQDLVWQVDNPLSAACGYGAHVASRSGVAPSWSWASVN